MTGNRNERTDTRETSIRAATLPSRRPASLSEKAQLVLQLWMIAALLTMIVKTALS